MESLSPAQVRDHLEMVDRILTRSERSLRVGGEFFLIWGLIGTSVTLAFQLAVDGRIPARALWVLPLFFAAGILFSILRGRQLGKCSEGLPLIQREFFAVLWISLGVAFFADAFGFRIFTTWASSAVWNFAAAIVLFFIAVHGNRRALVCGIIVLVSVAVANFLPAITGYVLAAGLLFGYAGFGLVSMTSRD
jgi:hypothetical protein